MVARPASSSKRTLLDWVRSGLYLGLLGAMFLPLVTIESCGDPVTVDAWRAVRSGPLTAVLAFPIVAAALVGLVLSFTLAPGHRAAADQWVGVSGGAFDGLLVGAYYGGDGLSFVRGVHVGAWVLLLGYAALLGFGSVVRLRDRSAPTRRALDPRTAASGSLACGVLSLLSVTLVFGPMAIAMGLYARRRGGESASNGTPGSNATTGLSTAGISLAVLALLLRGLALVGVFG